MHAAKDVLHSNRHRRANDHRKAQPERILSTRINREQGFIPERNNSSKRKAEVNSRKVVGNDPDEVEGKEEEGLINWDWIGEDGPMFAPEEAEFLLDRLCESLTRYMKSQARKEKNGDPGSRDVVGIVDQA